MNSPSCQQCSSASLGMREGGRYVPFNSRGFSMIEVALAIAVIGIALISILGLMGIAINTSTDARDDNQIGMLAAQLVADRSASPFLQPSGLYQIPKLDANGVNPPLYFGKNGRKLSTSSGAYYAIITESRVLSSFASQFDVRVIWPANNVKPSTNYFSTIIARGKP